MFSKQHLVANQRGPVPLSRRTILFGLAGYVLLQGRTKQTRAAAACDNPATTMMSVERGAPPIVDLADYWQLKDPCIVGDGRTWHMYGTGWKVGGAESVVCHARAQSPIGPFLMGAPSVLQGISGGGVAAPGVWFEDGVFHMFIQTEFQRMGGTIEHLVSTDGDSFVRTDTSLLANQSMGEAVIYDAQPCVSRGHRYLVYAAATTVGQTELHLARSTGTWGGPWIRLGPILKQSDVPFQDPVGCPGYEWGLEGPQLVELPNGEVLLVGVCFFGGLAKGHRQRVFAALAAGPEGPFDVLGILLDPDLDEWARGENGHPGAVTVGDDVILVYQGRQGAGAPWTLGTATLSVGSLRALRAVAVA